MEPKYIFFTKKELKELDEMLISLEGSMIRLKNKTSLENNLEKYNEIEKGLIYIAKIRAKLNE